ncbi:Holliday junction resolvase [Gordoniibacillus kamchatkensis]|uniref:Holliday junction resolvase n=1 Tax=Gordoniibacillus kamchatkensis TaxID=1590651 RepID=UPI001E51B9A8|nr:Holliday junction resolvase [Paenibacillus sp. VKM B-2647]
MIPGTLPTMNEIINISKRSKYAYRDLKEYYDNVVAWHAKAQHIAPVERANFIITWVCPDRLHNKDNIAAGIKFIFDGLQKAGILSNDGWKEIADFSHRFEVDKTNPRIEIEILEAS